ncbi:hypothetical protein CCAX7_41820 [Capsulimonas corticalis]|uniref:Uncharacterized protein n=1 Tax=Capsulimonas corticalis TaxID=2219043 RepID=A0A402CXZ2_9BACT|nr:metallophosphoesterase [Capsulimonas corticalis]BDI32131.1 hypothetical protein CCAX7_41820 [Capsulimonas corticalis]
MKQISRREFLHFAGGVTFLALAPNGQGLFAATEADARLPLFTVLPYIQPGSASKLKENDDTLVVAWQTEDAAADFTVAYGLSKKYGQIAVPIQGARAIGDAAVSGDAALKRRNYNAALTGLKLGRKYYYQVQGKGKVIAEGYATTRQPRGRKIRFVAFGDNSNGDVSDHRIAYQAYVAKPDFVMNTGDNVYQSGLDREYAKFFFPIYDATTAGPELGAPLLRSVPFYTVLANHDVTGRDAIGREAGDFTKHSDALAYYTAMHLPMNGPAQPADSTPTVCADPAVLAQFQACAGDRFPRMANYSFDNGDAHFLCLDANAYVDPTSPALQAWIEQDLADTDAHWKFVVYHQPAFNVGQEHYKEQHMRALSPIFEKHGVDIVLNGHEHTYQRTMPIQFEPTDLTNASHTATRDRIVPGKLTIDREFDGKEKTLPRGIIHVTTGAGGNALYEPEFTDSPDRWVFTDGPENHFVSKFYSREHSLSVIEIDGRALTLRQINEFGKEIDRIRVTKA